MIIVRLDLKKHSTLLITRRTCLAAPFAVVMLAKWGIAPPRAVEPLITAN